jgi:putative oxidoreductase
MAQADTAVRAYPRLTGLYETLEPLGYPLLRFFAGVIMIPHSIPKLFGTFAPVLAKNVLAPLGFLNYPDPLFWAYFLGGLEIVGGTLLALGLLTRPLALAFAIETAIITWCVAVPKGWVYSSPGGGAEFPFILFVVYVAILCMGPGGYSLDRLVAKRWGLRMP